MTTALCWDLDRPERSALVAVEDDWRSLRHLAETGHPDDIEIYATLAEAQRALRRRLANLATELADRQATTRNRITLLDRHLGDRGDDPDGEDAWRRFIQHHSDRDMRWTQ